MWKESSSMSRLYVQGKFMALDALENHYSSVCSVFYYTSNDKKEIVLISLEVSSVLNRNVHSMI